MWSLSRWNQQTVPYFVWQPQGYQEVVQGFSFTNTAVAAGNPAPTLQWKKDGVNISGATSTNYIVSSMGSTDGGTYVMVASNSNGSTSSSSAVVRYFSQGAYPLEKGNIVWTNSTFTLPFQHVSNYWYTVYGSFDLTNWTAITTNHVPFTFTEPNPTNAYKFYRSKFIGP